MEFVLGERRGVREGLPHVVFLKIGQVRDDLSRRHAIRDKVDDMDTEIRRPRIVARPARTLGFCVIRSNPCAMVSSLSF